MRDYTVRFKDCSIVLPTELQEKLQINENDLLSVGYELFEDGNYDIVISKKIFSCSLCENTSDLQNINGKYVCTNCINNIIELQKL